MKDLQISAKANAGKENEAVGSITVKAPETLAEAEQMYGGDAVLSNALANWVVTLQSTIRTGLKKGESQEAMQARLGDSKMGVAATKASVNPMDAVRAMFQNATPEQKEKILAQLMQGQAPTANTAAEPPKPKK